MFIFITYHLTDSTTNDLPWFYLFCALRKLTSSQAIRTHKSRRRPFTADRFHPNSFVTSLRLKTR
jgi:hypothetical protein